MAEAYVPVPSLLAPWALVGGFSCLAHAHRPWYVLSCPAHDPGPWYMLFFCPWPSGLPSRVTSSRLPLTSSGQPFLSVLTGVIGRQ